MNVVLSGMVRRVSMSYFEIKQATTHEEVAAVAALANDIWHECYANILSPEQIDYMMKTIQSVDRIEQDIKDGYEYYTAHLYGRLIGYMAMKPEDGYMFLSKIYIEKDFRGRKIADQFMQLIYDEAKWLGRDKIMLTVNKKNLDSITIYKKIGFEIVAEQVTDIGGGFVMDDYIMEKQL